MKGLQAQNKTRINVALLDVDGSDLNLQVGQASVMGEEIVAAWAKCARGLFVDTARDDQLDRIVFDRFGFLRKPANASTTDVLLARPNHIAGGGTIAAGSRATTPTGSIFALQTDVVFGATDNSKTGSVIAQVVGPTQNIPRATLTAWVDQPFDPIITITNTDAGAGGTAVESDPALRARARTFFLTLRRGILAAIQYGATTVDGVSVSTAFEIVNPGNALPAGAVQLVIADDNGNASGPMIQSVLDVMLSFRAAGIPVFVEGGTVQFEPVSFQLDFASGVDTVAASEEVRAVMVAFAQFLRPGQALLRSDCLAAARAVPGVIVGQGSLPVPVGDVIPVTNDIIIRVRPSDITFL